MNSIIQYIEEHLEEPLTVKQLTDVAGYSECHFVRVFKKYTGQTVKEYICRRRLIRSCDEILTGERLIDIAIKFGWSSHSAFSKSFHREFGFSPSLLRAMKLELDYLGGNYMDQIFLRSTQVGETKERLFGLLKEAVAKNRIAIDDAVLDTVYQLACRAYEGKQRYSGEAYITHPLNVAILLAELGVTADTVMAGIFCDVATKGNSSNLEQELPAGVWSVVKGLGEKQTEEAIIIKLAERLHNMRTIEFMDESKRAEKAKETIETYMPLARKIGNRKLTEELNNLALQYSM